MAANLRELGKGGPKVSPLGYGAMGLTSFYGDRVGREESLNIVRKAVDAGCTLIDTCDLYGPPMGENERLLGELLQNPEFRSKVLIGTKFGSFWTDKGPTGLRLDRAYVRQQCEESLKNLKVDYIDIFYQNRTGGDVPIEETWAEMEALRQEGKVKYLGISEASSEDIRRASKVAKISVLQIEFSPFTPDIRTNGILDTCRELGISIIAYSPLGRGFLTGKFDETTTFEAGDFRNIVPRFQGEALKENLKFVESLKAIAARKGCTPGQLCIAWVLAQGDDFIVLSGTKKEHYLRENIGALSVKLTPDEVAEVDKLIENHKIIGGRYPAGSHLGF